MFDKAPDKRSISQNNAPPPSPPLAALLPLLLYPPPLSLFRALFRGGLILFHSLAAILSSVNLSFRSGITQKNIKETLILKRCQSSAPSCNAPFSSHSFLSPFFFCQLRNLSGWAKCFLASHLLMRLHTGGDITARKAGSPCIEATCG